MSLTQKEQKESGMITLQQIGRETLHMLGAKNFVYGQNFIQFSTRKIKGLKGTFNKVVVKLNVMDTYDIELWNIDLLTEEYDSMTKLVRQYKDVYNSELTGYFLMELGL